MSNLFSKNFLLENNNLSSAPNTQIYNSSTVNYISFNALSALNFSENSST
jgi:hypothetical protein